MTTPETADQLPSADEPDRVPDRVPDAQISATAVAKIVAQAVRAVPGVHGLTSGGSRSIASVRDRLPGAQPAPTPGVSVEVGQIQTAIDLDIIVEYGRTLPDIARAVRAAVIETVEAMTGLEVVEVNITIDDVVLPEADRADGSTLN